MPILDEKDKEILMYLQKGIPIIAKPYQKMADDIGELTEDEVISRIKRLKADNIIRRMSGFFNSNQLGYVSTLVAVKPKAEKFDKAITLINSFTGITHNYLREHEYSIWFTLIAINQKTMESILNQIKNDDSIESLLPFGMKKRYKIDVTFDVKRGV